ncbi:hypothetical protein JD844_011815, partial [Phrynosoma platyrhinos]
HVPAELREPFYTDQYEQEHMKPPLIRLLLSSDIYCRAWRQALPSGSDGNPSPKDNAALLQLLARRGLGAHLALIDSLMTAYAVEATSSLSVAPGTDPAAISWDQKLLHWIDVIIHKIQQSAEQECSQRSAPGTDGQSQASTSGPKIRYRKDKALPKQTPCFSAIAGMKDLASGGAIAATIHYYCPQLIRLEDVCLKETMSVADSLYNLQLIQGFSSDYLGGACFLSLEDLLYMPPALRINVGVFLAELFLCFEVLKPDFVCPKELPRLQDSPGLNDSLTPNSGNNSIDPYETSTFPCVQALNVANTPPGALCGTSLVLCSSMTFCLFVSIGSLHHSTSMSHVEGFGKAWSKKPLSHPLSQAVSFSIPFGLDSDVDIVMGNPVGILRSVSSDSLAPALYSSLPRSPRTRASEVAEAPNGLVAPSLHGAGGHKSQEGLALENGLTDGYSDLPTIEEALQIIHSSERLLPEGAPDGFYLHSPDPPKASVPEKVPMSTVYRCHNGPPNGGEPAQDGSLDSDAEEASRPPGGPDDSTSCVSSLSSQPDSTASSTSGVRMTSFAERKKKLAATDSKSSGISSEGSETGPVPPDESPAQSPALSSEMSQLGARLEEKRRAIEAQKKRIEAIFTRHRQRLGKSAFLQLQKAPDSQAQSEDNRLTLEERLAQLEAEDEAGSPRTRLENKQVTFSPDITKGALDENLGDYNRAVAKLNTALSSLQMDMQRLSEQQQRLMQEKKPSAQAWVIPAPRASREGAPTRSSLELSSPSPSPSPSRKSRSPQPTPKKSPAPAPPKSPKHTRPVELKLPPLTRVLTPPHNVDNLPHLRKFSPSQVNVQTRSSIHFAEDEELPVPETEAQNNLRPVASVPPQGGNARVSGDGTSDVSSPSDRRSSLIEIPLSSLKGDEEDDVDGDDSLEESIAETLDSEPRSGLGFFFKDEEKAEDEMAQKRATFLERQQRRTEEARRRKQWQEEEKEQKKEEARLQAEERSRQEEEVGPRRGDFTRQEYLRRHQLKLMEDLDKVLRQKPTTVRALKKGRPKTVFCDDSALARSPVKGLLGSKLNKVYSQSTLSLSTVANDPGNSLPIKRSSRAASPSGPMSPSRLLPNQSRERDWENASTASSPASIPEYTGPKLYKEPSAKSNKYIIHNALSHCCLAGKVNEPQKNRILEEVEKSKANHFLILFRDSSCQFRALYTLSGETDELTRLAGYGPRTITLPMIEGIYKYSSDRKRFTQIPSKTMSMSVDAFTIQGHLWQTKRPGTPKKPGTPK